MKRATLLIGMAFLLAAQAYAELQNVQVGGEIRIRGRFWNNAWTSPGREEVRIPAFLLPGRPIGDDRGAVSRYSWDNHSNNTKYIEQRTLLNFKADFTDDVCAFIEFESYDRWGDDFRSNYITGADSRANTSDDLEVVQAYIQMDNICDTPLRARIGRQAITLGKGWLVNKTSPGTRAVIYDAIRLTYDVDAFSVDAFWSKLDENSPVEEDGDVDFYGVYATYKQLEALKASVYWLYLRDARSVSDTNFVWPLERLEDFFGLDDYDTTNLHTFGARLFGDWNGFDYDLEFAYQTGEADQVGSRFRPFLYGDSAADWDCWGGDIEIGYTVDIAWQPRVYIGGAYYDGDDNRDLTFVDWLNPFYRPQASLAFNRLFGGYQYAAIFDTQQPLSNFEQVRAGVEVQPTEKLTGRVQVAYYGAVDAFDRPASISLAGFDVAVAPALSFLTERSASDIGILADVSLKYDYSDDLWFAIGWEHLFAGDGLNDGSYTDQHGMTFMGGSDGDDADYVYFDTKLTF